MNSKINQPAIPADDFYFVMLDYGPNGLETVIDLEQCAFADVVKDIATGQHGNTPITAVMCGNATDGTLRDVTNRVAKAVIGAAWDRGAERGEELNRSVSDFCEGILGCEMFAAHLRDMRRA